MDKREEKVRQCFNKCKNKDFVCERDRERVSVCNRDSAGEGVNVREYMRESVCMRVCKSTCESVCEREYMRECECVR